MPQLTPSTVSILPPNQTSGGSLKEKAVSLRYNTHGSPDAQLWSTAGEAFSNAQSQIDNIVNALRSPLPQPQVIQITNPKGVLIAQIGNIVGANNVAYPGIWAQDVYIGGTGPDTAVIVANSNGVVINGAEIILTANGVQTIINNSNDPVTGFTESITSIDVSTTNGGYSFLSPYHFDMLFYNGTSYVPTIQLNNNANSDIAVSNNGSGGSHTIILASVTPEVIVFDGTNTATLSSVLLRVNGVNAVTSLEFNGVPGISTTTSFGTSLSVSGASALTSATGPGVTGTTSATFVTGVSLNVTSNTFSGGLLTA